MYGAQEFDSGLEGFGSGPVGLEALTAAAATHGDGHDDKENTDNAQAARRR